MRIIVVFNLRPGVDPAAYERWAREKDAPAVDRMASVTSFTVHKAVGLFGSDAPPPYQYVEVVDITDAETFGRDASTPQMQAIAAEFQQFADNPVFIKTQPLGDA